MRALSPTIVFLLALSPLYGQVFVFPKLQKTGNELNDFIPQGWILKDRADGDLNSDTFTDIAFVIELRDTVEEQRPDGEVLNSNPRIVAILLKNKSTYTLALQNDSFILRDGEGGMTRDPYDRVEIENGQLNISFQFTREFTKYTFQFQSNSFYLIRAVDSGVSGGKFESWDFDFLSKSATHVWGPLGDENTNRELREIPPDSLKKLDDMKQPFMWEVFPGVLI